MGERGASGEARRAWPSFLRGEDVHEVYAHLCNGDPLRVRERSARRLRETWYLLEPDRVCDRALPVIAFAARSSEPPEDLEAWTFAQIDRTIAQLVRADAEAERTRPGILTDEERRFPLLTQSMYLHPDLVRTASVAFNALPPLPRRAFYELLIEGMDVHECVERGPWNHDELYIAIHESLAAVGLDLYSDRKDGYPFKMP